MCAKLREPHESSRETDVLNYLLQVFGGITRGFN
jgi:hypothetical protein